MANMPVPAQAAKKLFKTAVSLLFAGIAYAYFNGPAQAEGLVLEALIDEALSGNPSITASENMSEAARERVPQAGTLDDPMLTIGVANIETEYFAFDRIPMTSKNIGISQKFPFFGKLDLKERAAANEAEAVDSMVGEKRLTVAYKVKDAYYDLALAGKELEILDKQTALVRLVGRTARSRYSVGEGTIGDSLKAEVEEARLIEMKETVKRRERTIRAMLGNLTGRGAPVEGGPAWPEPACEPPGRETLLELAIANRPGIDAADAMIEKGRRMTELAELGYYPDMGVSITYHQLDDLKTGVQQSDRLTAMLSFNLPIWRGSKLDPAAREAAAMRASAESAKDSLINEIGYRLDSLLADTKRENELVRLYGDALLPLSKKELDAELDRYSVGEMDLSDLLMTVRELYEYELGGYRSQIAREKAIAGIEAAVGLDSDSWCEDLKPVTNTNAGNQNE